MCMSIIRTNDQAKQSARDVVFIVCWKRCALNMSNHSCTCVGPSVWVFIFIFFIYFFYFVSVFTVLSLVTCLDRPM